MNIKLDFNNIKVKETKKDFTVKILMLKGEKGDTGSPEWGGITGNITNQTDLKNALDLKANASDIPTKVSDLTNDSGFITKAVNDLTNYYLKSETYTKTEVNNLIGQITSFSVEIVQSLPTTDISPSTIYFVQKSGGSTGDVYNEYLYINNSWELIGTTEIDLSNYYTKTQIDTFQTNQDNKINKKIYYFNTIADMKAYNLSAGDMAITKGYYSSNDGGNGEYTIVNDSNLVDDGGSVHNLQNGLKAILVADDIVNIHQFGAKGDGTTDDTNAITNALTYANSIKGIEDKTYYITSSIQVTDKNISNLHIKSSPFNAQTGNTYFVVFVLNGENNLENVFVESEFEYTPSIDKYADPQTQTTGKASNVKAFRVISGETTFNNCKTNYCWSFDIYGTSKANIHNAVCTNTEMSFYNQSIGEVKVYDSTFIINKLVDSGYYHHIYTKEATNMFFYNCKFEEVGTGNIGNHYHGYSTSFDPNEDTLGYLEINNCTLITSTDAGQLNAVNLVVNGGSIECSKLTTGGDYIDSPKASFNNVYIKINNNSNTTLSNCKTTIDNCIIDITASGTKKICKFAYKLFNSIINILNGTLSFDCEIATSSNILNDEVVVSNNTINTDSVSWLYPPYASNIKISNNTYNLGTLKTTINPTDRSSSGYVMNCIFKNWTTPLNANSSNGLKYRYIADGILKSNITDNTIPSIPTKTSDLTNDSGFITSYDASWADYNNGTLSDFTELRKYIAHAYSLGTETGEYKYVKIYIINDTNPSFSEVIATHYIPKFEDVFHNTTTNEKIILYTINKTYTIERDASTDAITVTIS